MNHLRRAPSWPTQLASPHTPRMPCILPSFTPFPLDCRTSFGILELGDGPLMAERDEPIAQLATRIPKELHRRLKLHCVTCEIAVQDFVVEAIEEKLGRKARPKKGKA